MSATVRCLALILLAVNVACVRGAQAGIEVDRGKDFDDNLAIARSLASEQGLAELKREICVRLPTVKEEHLKNLSIVSNRVIGDSKVDSKVRVIIGIQDSGLDVNEVIRVASEIVRSRVKK
jgi:hypothetical protein